MSLRERNRKEYRIENGWRNEPCCISKVEIAYPYRGPIYQVGLYHAAKQDNLSYSDDSVANTIIGKKLKENSEFIFSIGKTVKNGILKHSVIPEKFHAHVFDAV